MLALVSKTNYGRLGILDTDDGVVEYIPESEFERIKKSGLRVYERLELTECTSLYNNMTKTYTLKKDFDYNYQKYIYMQIQKITGVLDFFEAPESLYKFDMMIDTYDGFYLVLFKRFAKDLKKDYLYLISQEGIFYFNQKAIKAPYSLDLAKNDEGDICVTVTDDKTVMSYSTYILDKRLNIVRVIDERQAVKPKIGKELK